ncbi:unnamed protein product [Somion occarium]|uniref:Uncharacterized protein n=1 Tax=Somion occarium TaxID=3059160 RepID=A0ABP1CX35_9APHY
MPPKAQPKTYILLIKTHKLTLLVTSNATNNINSLKVEVVSGFNASALNPSSDGLIPMDVDTQDPEWEVPKIQSVNDFELCRAIKEKGRLTGRYEVLDGNASIKSTLVNWEYVFMRFRDQQVFSPNCCPTP